MGGSVSAMLRCLLSVLHPERGQNPPWLGVAMMEVARGPVAGCLFYISTFK